MELYQERPEATIQGKKGDATKPEEPKNILAKKWGRLSATQKGSTVFNSLILNQSN